jgi:hypothetical protein
MHNPSYPMFEPSCLLAPSKNIIEFSDNIPRIQIKEKFQFSLKRLVENAYKGLFLTISLSNFEFQKITKIIYRLYIQIDFPDLHR